MRRNVTRTSGLGSSDGWMQKEVIDKQSTTAMQEQPCSEADSMPVIEFRSIAMMESKANQIQLEEQSKVAQISQ